MDPAKKIDIYEALTKRILRSKLQGYKRFGAMTGASLGSGIGGTVGLIDTVNRHREGEFDDLDTKDKVLEYLKGMGSKAAIGGGIGAVAGTGLGELGRRYSARSAFNEGGKDSYKKLFRDFRKSPKMFDKHQQDLKGTIKDLKKEPVFNIIDDTKDFIKEKLTSKKAEQKDMNNNLKEYFVVKATELKLASAVPPIVHPTGLRRGFAALGALSGSGAGGVAGAGIGAIKGLISPDEEVDPKTGKTVQSGRLASMASNAGKGFLAGKVLGAGVGAGVGTHIGSISRKRIQGVNSHVPMKDFMNSDAIKGFHTDVLPEYYRHILEKVKGMMSRGEATPATPPAA